MAWIMNNVGLNIKDIMNSVNIFNDGCAFNKKNWIILGWTMFPANILGLRVFLVRSVESITPPKSTNLAWMYE